MSNPPAPEPTPPPIHPRLLPGEGAGPIWMITLLAFGAWLMIGSLYATLKLSRMPASTTPPTTQFAYTPAETIGLGVAASVGVLVVLLGANLAARPDGLQRLGLSPRRLPGGLIAGLACAAVIVPGVFGFVYTVQYLYEAVGFQHPGAHPLLRAFESGVSPFLRGCIIATAALLAPVSEELLFRGHLQTAIAASIDPRRGPWRRWIAILITSVVFAIFHGELWMMPPIFFLSLCLGLIYEWTGSLWVSMTVHAAFNTVSMAYFLWLIPQR